MKKANAIGATRTDGQSSQRTNMQATVWEYADLMLGLPMWSNRGKENNARMGRNQRLGG
jgi:hypothetical protein